MREEGLKPTLHVETVPMLIPTTTTFEGIGERMLARMLDAEQEIGVIDVSWFHGFPYTDTAHVGMHVVVTTSGDHDQAVRIARGLAETLWNERDAFRARSLSAAEAVAEAQALSCTARPVVINETSDNPGGGTPGDGTHLLRAMLEARLTEACFGFVVDSEVAAQAYGRHRFDAGRVARKANTTICTGAARCRAYVKSLSDGRS
jgi:microcystin degradation protein MlrC